MVELFVYKELYPRDGIVSAGPDILKLILKSLAPEFTQHLDGEEITKLLIECQPRFRDNPVELGKIIGAKTEAGIGLARF